MCFNRLQSVGRKINHLLHPLFSLTPDLSISFVKPSLLVQSLYNMAMWHGPLVVAWTEWCSLLSGVYTIVRFYNQHSIGGTEISGRSEAVLLQPLTIANLYL